MVGNLLMHTESAGYSTQILACDTVNCARRLHLVIGLTQFRYTHTVRTNFWESERIHNCDWFENFDGIDFDSFSSQSTYEHTVVTYCTL